MAKRNRWLWIERNELQLAMKQTRVIGEDFKVARKKGNKEALKIVYAAIMENIVPEMYEPKVLAGLDHPFARRHGAIQTSSLGGPWTRRPYTVQDVTGKFRKSFKPSIKRSKNFGYAAHIEIKRGAMRSYEVIQGTRYTLPRDIIGGTMAQKDVQDKLSRAYFKIYTDQVRRSTRRNKK